jgi:hypothetical protein
MNRRSTSRTPGYLYRQTLKLADADHASNSRSAAIDDVQPSPLYLPDDRIDIINGRDGAVKYTDYAIGEFLDQARKSPGSTIQSLSSSPTTPPAAQAGRLADQQLSDSAVHLCAQAD